MSDPIHEIQPDPEFKGRFRVIARQYPNNAPLCRGTEAECIAWLKRQLSRERQDAALRGIFGY